MIESATTPGRLRCRQDEAYVDLVPHFDKVGRQLLAEVRWSLTGAEGAPVVAVLGGISANRRVVTTTLRRGWWDSVVTDGGAIDLARWRVLSFDWLTCADLGSPAVDAGARPVSTFDQAAVLAGVLDALGIGRLHAFVGCSYGAMVGLAFAARDSDRLDRLVAVSGTDRPHPWATAQRSIQREIVRFAASAGRTTEGLTLARQLAMTSYRTPEELESRFDRQPSDRVLPVEQWLRATGARWATTFDAERFLSLSESIDLHRIDPVDVTTPTTVVAVTSDRLVPLADAEQMVTRLGGPATLEAVLSPYGHDAFLKSPHLVGPPIQRALAAALPNHPADHEATGVSR